MRIFSIITFILLFISADAQVSWPLYNEVIPNAKQVINAEYTVPHDIVDSLTYKVVVPTLTFYPAERPISAASIIIVPGGGYQVLLTKREGSDIARALNKRGYNCFVLKYRLPDDKSSYNKSIAPIQDLQQALRLVKQQAGKWNLHPDSVGIMGFSAGGHLVSTAISHFDSSFADLPGTISLRPSFAILINPVIRLHGSYTHTGTKQNLLGINPSEEKAKFFSADGNVKINTPPCLFVHSVKDTVVGVENSLLMFSALRNKNIPVAIHIYGRGEHGLLTAPKFEEWFERCIYWLKHEL